MIISICLPRWLSGKESACQCRRWKRPRFDPRVMKFPWMATHSNILAWKITWTEEPSGLRSTGSQSWTWLSWRACKCCLHAMTMFPQQPRNLIFIFWSFFFFSLSPLSLMSLWTTWVWVGLVPGCGSDFYAHALFWDLATQGMLLS